MFHARGLHQGDPLLPMLFVLVMEVINHTVRWLDDEGLLAQLGATGTVQRVSLYADDLVLFVEPNDQDLRVLKSTLQIFGLASGLFANFWAAAGQLICR
jgi:hypothetical protein